MENKVKLEWSVVSSLLAQPDGTVPARLCAGMLRAEDFTNAEARNAWEAIAALVKDKEEVNLMNAFTKAQANGRPIDLSKLNAVGYDGDTPLMASVIHEYGMRRRLADRLRAVIERMEEPDFSAGDAVATISEATAEASKSNARSLTEWPDLYKRVLSVIEDRANGKGAQGVPSGYTLIDDEGGLTEGALMVVAGRTSNGKTAFALNVALNVAMQGIPTVVYSLEMTNEQVGSRLLANLSGVPQSNLKSGILNEEQWAMLIQAGAPLPLYFDDGRATSKDAIFNAIRDVVETRGVRVVFIDYLQLVKGAGKDRRHDIGDIANELKVLAVQLKITVVLLSQLAREAKGLQPVPRISELKESGEIENAADSVYLVYRPEQHGADAPFPDLSRRWSDYDTRGNALLICAKNRNGQTGEQLLGFDGDTSRFFQRDRYETATFNREEGFTPLWQK